jgi:hypothetical protein
MSIETEVNLNIRPILASLRGAAGPNGYLTLDTVDRIFGKWGLLDLNAGNGERGLMRGRAKAAVNDALSHAHLDERLVSVREAEAVAGVNGVNHPGGWAYLLGNPVETFAIEARKRHQKVKNHLGRAFAYLSELRVIALQVDEAATNDHIIDAMGTVLGRVEGVRDYIDFQLGQLSRLSDALQIEADDTRAATTARVQGRNPNPQKAKTSA